MHRWPRFWIILQGDFVIENQFLQITTDFGRFFAFLQAKCEYYENLNLQRLYTTGCVFQSMKFIATKSISKASSFKI